MSRPPTPYPSPESGRLVPQAGWPTPAQTEGCDRQVAMPARPARMPDANTSDGWYETRAWANGGEEPLCDTPSDRVEVVVLTRASHLHRLTDDEPWLRMAGSCRAAGSGDNRTCTNYISPVCVSDLCTYHGRAHAGPQANWAPHAQGHIKGAAGRSLLPFGEGGDRQPLFRNGTAAGLNASLAGYLARVRPATLPGIDPCTGEIAPAAQIATSPGQHGPRLSARQTQPYVEACGLFLAGFVSCNYTGRHCLGLVCKLLPGRHGRRR